MRRITRDDAIRAAGISDDAVAVRMIQTGATIDELAEAQAWIANDEPLMNAGKPLATGRVRDILSELQPSEDDDDPGKG